MTYRAPSFAKLWSEYVERGGYRTRNDTIKLEKVEEFMDTGNTLSLLGRDIDPFLSTRMLTAPLSTRLPVATFDGPDNIRFLSELTPVHAGAILIALTGLIQQLASFVPGSFAPIKEMLMILIIAGVGLHESILLSSIPAMGRARVFMSYLQNLLHERRYPQKHGTPVPMFDGVLVDHFGCKARYKGRDLLWMQIGHTVQHIRDTIACLPKGKILALYTPELYALDQKLFASLPLENCIVLCKEYTPRHEWDREKVIERWYNAQSNKSSVSLWCVNQNQWVSLPSVRPEDEVLLLRNNAVFNVRGILGTTRERQAFVSLTGIVVPIVSLAWYFISRYLLSTNWNDSLLAKLTLKGIIAGGLTMYAI